jgi:6-phosphofructokinase 1
LARKGHALLVFTEFIEGKDALLAALPDLVGTRLRDSKLGHAQRGGVPSHRDRILGAEMARAAYTALKTGATQGIAIVRAGKVVIYEGGLAGLPPRTPDRALYDAINGIDA